MMKNKLGYLITVFISLILLEAGLLYALGWYWSCFKWSPFGYECCGLEILAILFVTWPAFIIGLLARLCLLFRWKMSHAVWAMPFLLCGIASCAFQKSLEMGIFCIISMLVLPITDILTLKKAVRK